MTQRSFWIIAGEEELEILGILSVAIAIPGGVG